MLAFGPNHVLVSIGLFFSKLAVVSFGGAYALLAYMAQQAVETHHWMTAAEMVDGLGLAETTPGPLILVTQFVGFLAGFRDAAPFSPVTMGILGAAMTTWVTFTPSMLWIFAGAPFVEQLRANKKLSGALAAITRALADEKKVDAPKSAASAKVNDAARAIARSLASGKSTAILLGNFAEQHANGKASRAEYENSKQGWVYDVEVVSGAKVLRPMSRPTSPWRPPFVMPSVNPPVV